MLLLLCKYCCLKNDSQKERLFGHHPQEKETVGLIEWPIIIGWLSAFCENR